MKIAVLGYSGAGKSATAARLGKRFGVNVLHLDKVHFLPDWEERGTSEKMRLVGGFMRDNEDWVIDGNYSSLFRAERLEQADIIVLLLFGRFSCLWRVFKRYREYKGKTRPDIADGCPERLDLKFIAWVLHGGRTRAKKADYKAVYQSYHDKVVVLKNQRRLDRFLQSLGA